MKTLLLFLSTSAILLNILIIYADDLGYGDVQCYNAERGKPHNPS